MYKKVNTGTELKELRKELNISRRNLSRETGISESLLQKIEDGRKAGSEETWNKINRFLSNHNNSTSLISRIEADMLKYKQNQPIRIIVSASKRGLQTFKIEGYEIVKDGKFKPGIYTTLEHLKLII